MCTSETACACSTTTSTAPPVAAQGVRKVYQVAGMTCGSCASRVGKQIAGIAGVDDVDVDVATGAVTVTSGSHLDDDAVEAAVTEAGYQVVH